MTDTAWSSLSLAMGHVILIGLAVTGIGALVRQRLVAARRRERALRRLLSRPANWHPVA